MNLPGFTAEHHVGFGRGNYSKIAENSINQSQQMVVAQANQQLCRIAVDTCSAGHSWGCDRIGRYCFDVWWF